MDPRKLALALILGASVLVAAALYLGRTEHDEPSSSPLSVDARANDGRPDVRTGRRPPGIGGGDSVAEIQGPDRAPTDSRTASNRLPGLAAPKPSPEMVANQARVSEAFERIRDEIVQDCWDPAGEGPQAVDLKLSVAFNRQGRLIGHGVHPLGPSRGGLAECVGRHLPKLSIDADGANVSTDVDVKLP